MNDPTNHWFAETLHGSYEQRLEISDILYRSKSGLQDIIIFETPFFGKAASAGSLIAFNLHHEDLDENDHGVICSFGAGYSIGSLVVRKRAVRS